MLFMRDALVCRQYFNEDGPGVVQTIRRCLAMYRNAGAGLRVSGVCGVTGA